LGNLSYCTSEQSLEAKFSEFGKIIAVRILLNDRNQSNGFGFLEFETEAGPQNAINEMDGREFEGLHDSGQPSHVKMSVFCPTFRKIMSVLSVFIPLKR
jgi:hypothetical protein